MKTIWKLLGKNRFDNLFSNLKLLISANLSLLPSYMIKKNWMGIEFWQIQNVENLKTNLRNPFENNENHENHEIHLRIMKIMEIKENPCENKSNLENHINPYEKNENHENHRNP